MNQSLLDFGRTISVAGCCCCALLLISSGGSTLMAQDTKSKEQAELVDGLLDLLNEPPPVMKKPAESSPAGTSSGAPSGIELDDEQLGQQAANPLYGVRQNMLIAAGYLSKGFVNQQTRQLQTEIVERLDELIDELEQSNSSQQQAAQQQEQQQRQQQAQSEQQSSAANQTQASTSPAATENQAAGDTERQPGQSEPTSDSPAQKGQAVRPKVELVDPKTLQQNVWGQLPEQVRKQMQSRMVEEFLPSYRQQIEAYFQALLESKPTEQ